MLESSEAQGQPYPQLETVPKANLGYKTPTYQIKER